MTGGEDQCETETNILMFPCPAQGHVNCMLQLAELLALSNIHVTFLNTEHVHRRLLRFANIHSRLAAYPTLHFESFSDGLPADDSRHVVEQIKQVNLTAMPQLREICMEASGKPRFSCIIGDGIFGRFTNELGQELGIPVVSFRTISACCFWAYFCAPRLFECNELPILGEEDMDRMITGIPGMENLVRCRDLPSFFRGNGSSGYIPTETLVFETHQSLGAQALILNTFEDLEGDVLSQLRLHFPRLYSLGPLHAHLTSRKASKTTSSEEEKPPPSFTNNSLWEVDRTCMTWLDAQPPKSVVYVSFGSITTISRDELMEIWYGLVNSKKQFLWVIRPDMVAEQEAKGLPLELVEGTKERGCMVGWAPQQEVLEHVAIGGFMTHSGWNSTLEGVVAGVPMLCWPYFADQQINSRYVSEVWKIGLDMKDTCDRKIVEKMVNDLMGERREEFQKSTEGMATLAKTSVREGGSSHTDFDRFVGFLKSL